MSSIDRAKADLFAAAAHLEEQGLNPHDILRRGGVRDAELLAERTRAGAAEARVAQLNSELVERVLRAAEQLSRDF